MSHFTLCQWASSPCFSNVLLHLTSDPLHLIPITYFTWYQLATLPYTNEPLPHAPMSNFIWHQWPTLLSANDHLVPIGPYHLGPITQSTLFQKADMTTTALQTRQKRNHARTHHNSVWNKFIPLFWLNSNDISNLILREKPPYSRKELNISRDSPQWPLTMNKAKEDVPPPPPPPQEDSAQASRPKITLYVVYTVIYSDYT